MTTDVRPFALHVPDEALADLRDRLREQSAGLGSPWADAQVLSATGQLALLRDEPEALGGLTRAHARLVDLGFELDAARAGSFALAAGLRDGRVVLELLERFPR